MSIVLQISTNIKFQTGLIVDFVTVT